MKSGLAHFFLSGLRFLVSAAEGEDQDGDEWQVDDPEGVVVEMRREDGSSGSAGKEGEDDAGEFAELAQAGFARGGSEGVI